MPAKTKVAVAVSPELLELVERVRRSRPDRPSRSRIFEEALRAWWEEQERARIEQDVEVYYRSMSREEREEEARWGEAAAAAAREAWED